jgi:hypothetical protein
VLVKAMSDYVLQDLAEPWWENASPPRLEAGRLVRTFIPFPDVATLGLKLEGRADERDHSAARFRVEPIRGGRPPAPSKLPVAALPTNPGESYVVQRGKRRPALVLTLGGPEVPRSVATGAPGYQRRSCVLVAPYYGADQGGTRGGFSAAFLERIRRAEYPQFMADKLPIDGAAASVLRLDHVLSLGSDPNNFELTEHRLSAPALEVVLDWFQWLVEGVIPKDGLLELARSELRAIDDIE